MKKVIYYIILILTKKWQQSLPNSLLKKLKDSITPETIEEWGRNQMRSHIKDDYAPHPDAKGYEDKK